jgi:hypothetical protein
MLLSERIQQYVQTLPAPLQAQVLDYVEYLMAKAEQEVIQQEKKDWSRMSLSSAMHRMENEDVPTYTTSDLKVAFS